MVHDFKQTGESIVFLIEDAENPRIYGFRNEIGFGSGFREYGLQEWFRERR
jgi:hypothetical protein